MTEIPFLDLARLHAGLKAELSASFDEVVASSRFVGAAASAAFEREFAAAHGSPHAVGCGSGTDALILALRALDVGPGDEVIVPAMTFFATAEAVIRAGATPVLADVDHDELLLRVDEVDRLRTRHTRAVIPVALYGNLVPPSHFAGWRADGLRVIEDAAQAHLASRDDRMVGSAADAACFSFYPGKNLGALGDAGAVLTADAELAERLRQLRDHGSSQRYIHEVDGYCSRLDGLQAAVLRVKLHHLGEWTDARRQLAELYRTQLGEAIPVVGSAAGAVHHLMVVRVPSRLRERVRRDLADAGIETAIHYPRSLCDQPALASHFRDCPEARSAAEEVLSLPLDPLMTPDEVRAVCSRLVGSLAQLHVRV